MPQARILNFANIDTGGVCHAICGQWVACREPAAPSPNPAMRKSRRRPGTIRRIDRDNLLDQLAERFAFDADRNGSPHPQMLATKIAGKWNSYSIMPFRGGGGAGHSIAAKLLAGDIQFSDPNFGNVSLNNRRALFTFLPGHAQANRLSRLEVIR